MVGWSVGWLGEGPIGAECIEYAWRRRRWIGLEEQGQGERRKEGGQALGKRIKAAAAASSHEQNRGRRGNGRFGIPERILPPSFLDAF